MKTGTKKKVTLMLDERVYSGLQARVGSRGVGAYLSQLAKPYVLTDDLEAGYQAMAKDSARECETVDWLAVTADAGVNEENTWKF